MFLVLAFSFIINSKPTKQHGNVLRKKQVTY